MASLAEIGIDPVTNASPFAGPAQMTTIATKLAAEIGRTVATLSALPATGNWKGRTIWVEDIDEMRRWNGSGWAGIGNVPLSMDLSTFGLGSGVTVASGGYAVKRGSYVEVSLRFVRAAKLVGSGSEQLGVFPSGWRPPIPEPLDVYVMSGVGRGFGWGFVDTAGLFTVAAPFQDSTAATGAVTVAVKGTFRL